MDRKPSGILKWFIICLWIFFGLIQFSMADNEIALGPRCRKYNMHGFCIG